MQIHWIRRLPWLPCLFSAPPATLDYNMTFVLTLLDYSSAPAAATEPRYGVDLTYFDSEKKSFS